MKRKLMGFVAVILLVSFAMTTAGCSKAPATEPPKKEPVQIEFWHGLGGKLGEVLEGQIKKFNESHPDIVVKGVFYSDYATLNQKLQAAIVAGNPPAIAQLEDFGIQQLAAAGRLAPLDDLIANDPGFDLKDYVQGFINAASYQGKIYGIPLNRSTPILFYRKDILAKQGIDVSKLQTWEGVREVSKKLVDDKVVQYGFEPIKITWFFVSLVRSNGGDLMSADNKDIVFDSPEAAAALQFWADMIHKDKTATVHYGGQGWAYWYDTINDVMQGKAAMYTGSTGDQGDLDEKIIGAAFMPRFNGKEFSVPIGGANGAILAGTNEDQKKAAFEFLKWFTSKEETAYWAQQTGYMPVRYSAAEAMKQFFAEHPNFAVAVDQLKYARPVPLIPSWSQIDNEAITPALDEVYVNNTSAAKALGKAAEKARDILKKNQ